MARAVSIQTLRRAALRQLNERLKEGKMSTADLIRAASMRSVEEDTTPPWGRDGDWVLTVAGEDDEDGGEEEDMPTTEPEDQPGPEAEPPMRTAVC